jgi:hypothetical protein
MKWELPNECYVRLILSPFFSWLSSDGERLYRYFMQDIVMAQTGSNPVAVLDEAK